MEGAGTFCGLLLTKRTHTLAISLDTLSENECSPMQQSCMFMFMLKQFDVLLHLIAL